MPSVKTYIYNISLIENYEVPRVVNFGRGR